MHWLGWIVVLLAIIEGGWLAYDGGHALILGDYVTPKSGQYQGQLGPWSKVVSAIGIEPRSTLMKCIHLIFGIAWIVGLQNIMLYPQNNFSACPMICHLTARSFLSQSAV